MSQLIIEPTNGWRILDVKELWRYRELLFVLTARDIKIRYKQTALGALWAILQPLSAMLVFTFIFGKVAKFPSDGVPYPLFVFAGMLPWQLFSTSIGNSSSSVLNSAQLITKVYFPRMILPIASVGSAIVDFFISTTILAALMAYFRFAPTWQMLAMPVLLLGTLLCAVGTGALLSGLTVRYRDFRYVIPFTLQLWMYGSPVVYSSKMIPEQYQFWVNLNPMTGFIGGFRSCFLGTPFDYPSIQSSFLVSVAIFVFGALVFARTERSLADII
ncbi:MAG: ABC transporter permease [Deltaproteobacteria bacterium]|nr:ABC transporter permease [Deltaproteobacteria bacterium]